MRAQELFNFCAVHQYNARAEAEAMKESTDIDAWEMWYERSIGKAEAFFQMKYFIQKEAEKYGEELDMEYYQKLL